MGRLGSLPSAVVTDDSALGGAVIEKGLRFNDDDSPYLSRTFGSAGNRRTFTFSAWVKLSISSVHSPFFTNSVSSNFFKFQFRSDGRIEVNTYEGTDSSQVITTRRFSDASSWYHVVVAYDTTQASSSNRVKIYINGIQETAFDTNTIPSQNHQTAVNLAGQHQVGGRTGSSQYFNGYMAEVHFIDGFQLTPSSFGYTEFQTEIWRPKAYVGSYGTNGFYLDFSDNSATTAVTLGKDRSGQGNDYTPNNFSVSAGEANDSSLDTPSDNFVTLNPLKRFTHNCTLSNGNLKATGPNQSYPGAAANIALSSGKWYYEFQINTKTSNPMCGVCKNDYVSGGAGRILYRADGRYIMHDGSEPSDPDSYGVGDIIGVAIDLDDAAGKIRFYKNGTLQTVNSNLNSLKSQLSISTLGGLLPYIQMYHNDVCTVNFGQRPYNYTPPAGFKSLSTNNFFTQQTPHIISPKKHFDTLTYTGNGGTQSITGLNFAPDLVWLKVRSHSGDNHHLYDTIRGAAKTIFSNTTGTEQTSDTDRLSAFNSNGFTLGNNYRVNGSGRTFVAWCWKAGGSAVSNSDGTITSSVSANTEAGFSIVSYTGNETNNATVGHGLGKSPDMVIIKDRVSNSAGNNWYVFHSGLASGHYVKLNQTSASAAVSGTSNGGVGSVTSTTFNFVQGTSGNNKNVNENGDNFIAYCWTSIPGFSKFGVYEGNQNANGTYIHLGFRPAFIMIKNIDNGSNRQWCIIDTTRTTFNNPASAEVLFANDNQSESVANNNYGQFASKPAVDILSDGFKVREGETSAYTQLNRSNTHIYMAFAEQPGSTAYRTETNAR